MNTRIKNMLARAGSAERPGFTLIELLIAVGALAFIAAGVAAIFDATGRTITAGKRVSAFGQYASLIERQMRADFESMTRDGFLVIRNELADGDGDNVNEADDLVDLYDGDTRPRGRRIDEIMFFSKGQFASAREALHPDATARSDTARIYYGHGKRMAKPAFNAGHSYFTPRLGDTNEVPSPALGNRSAGDHPNRFASDWILLRHVTLLRPPESTIGDLSSTQLLAGYGRNALRDSDTQIGLQPAAPNLFRALNAIFPTSAPTNVIRTDDRLFFASGLIDIATTSLWEIRSIVTTADTWPGSPPSGMTGERAADDRFFLAAQNSGVDGTNAGVDGTYRLSATGSDQWLLARTHAWMSDALPAWSTDDVPQNRTRVRCEPTPTNYVGSITDATGPWAGNLAAAIRRADQLMLSSSNFLPRCSEFIVEWSFGHTWPSDVSSPHYDPARVGELVWYGMPRRVNDDYVAAAYDSSFVPNPNPWSIRETQSFTRVNGTTGTIDADAALIHGGSFNAASAYDQISSFFGYIDPRFNPDANGDGKLESATDAASPTIPCIWPKLIRVTLSLADPADPSIEQTFQFVFEVPAPADQ